MVKNESKTLNESFEQNINPEIKSNLENLKGLIDPMLFKQFEARIIGIIGENPGSEDIVVSELGKTCLSVENLFQNYNTTRLPGVVMSAANDENYGLAA